MHEIPMTSSTTTAATRGVYRPGLIVVGAIAALFIALLAFAPIARRFGVLGIEHILTGYDHLAFLVMLLVATHAVRDLFWVITSFTVAHSITLSAASLGWVVASAQWVEPLILATIVYVAVENLITARPRARVALTFAFGLVHGLGFASALSEGPLARGEEVLALLAFNLGVEVGQLAFLALAYPLWRALARVAPRAGRWILALGVIALCIYWFIDRL